MSVEILAVVMVGAVLWGLAHTTDGILNIRQERRERQNESKWQA